jgi:hypothetical protein
VRTEKAERESLFLGEVRKQLQICSVSGVEIDGALERSDQSSNDAEYDGRYPNPFFPVIPEGSGIYRKSLTTERK